MPLPDILTAYFAASNAHDADAVAATFSPDGHVHDEDHDHRGRAAIAAWARDTFARYAMTTEALSADAAGNIQTVIARVTGTFPGSPLDLHYRFTLGATGIDTLEITA